MRSEIVAPNGKVLHLGLANGQLAENVFLVGDPARALRVASRFDSLDCEVRNREFVTLTGRHEGMPVSVIGTGIGVDNVEIALIEAYTIAAFDLTTSERLDDYTLPRFIRIGTSAGIQDAVAPGTLAIATYALGLDNCGLYYDHPPADDVVLEIERQAYEIVTAATSADARFRGKIIPYAAKATPAVAAALADEARRLGMEYVSGITSATPGFYGPSSRTIEGLANTVASIKTKLANLQVQDQRVVNMEMESSLLFHIAAQLGCEVGTICPVISRPTAATDIFDYADSIENAISVALAAVAQLQSESATE